MRRLKRLDLSGNQISITRVAIPALPELDELRLSSNGMTTLPQGIQGLSTLSILDLGTNKLIELPESTILALGSLQTLDVSNNELKELPARLGNMTGIRALVLHGNPLRSIRQPIKDKGTVAVMDFLRSRIVEDPSGAPAEEPIEGEVDVAALMEGYHIRIGQIEEEMNQPGLSGIQPSS